VGINGAGKSSILDCIAMFLSQFASFLSNKNSRGNEFAITENDINIEAEETNNIITVDGFYNPKSDEDTFSWMMVKSRSSPKHRDIYPTTPSLYSSQIYQRISENPNSNLTVLAYYQNQKIFLEKPAKPKKKDYEFSQFYAYENAFKKGAHDFNDFAAWFRLEEDWENEKKLEKGLDFVNKNLEVVRRAIQTFLEKIPLAGTTHSPQVLSNVEKENILILEDYKIVKKTPFTYGRDSNSILYDLMNVEERPANVKKEFDKLYRLIDAEKLHEARMELKKLANVLGEDDKEIIRANMYINFIASGGQGDSFRENRPPGPVKHPQKLFIKVYP
jgi:predicted ATP-binding protein involved in virulence